MTWLEVFILASFAFSLGLVAGLVMIARDNMQGQTLADDADAFERRGR
jgi:hypothetical protein